MMKLPTRRGALLEFSRAGGSASKMFASVDPGSAPGPPDLPKLIETLKENGVALARSDRQLSGEWIDSSNACFGSGSDGRANEFAAE